MPYNRATQCCPSPRVAFAVRQLWRVDYVVEIQMKLLRVLDSSGDRMITFDQTKATTQARTEAQALFERLLANGSSAFKVNRADGKPDEKVTEFSTLENETIVVPRVVGG